MKHPHELLFVFLAGIVLGMFIIWVILVFTLPDYRTENMKNNKWNQSYSEYKENLIGPRFAGELERFLRGRKNEF